MAKKIQETQPVDAKRIKPKTKFKQQLEERIAKGQELLIINVPTQRYEDYFVGRKIGYDETVLVLPNFKLVLLRFDLVLPRFDFVLLRFKLVLPRLDFVLLRFKLVLPRLDLVLPKYKLVLQRLELVLPKY